MKSKLISPSTIIKFLFPEKYGDIPKWILDESAEFGKELHKLFELYLNDNSVLDEIQEIIKSDPTKQAIFNNFFNIKQFFKIKAVKTEKEFKNKSLGLHGFVDCLTPTTIYDWKIRSNLNSKDNFLCEKIQMIAYSLILKEKYDWKVIIFQKSQKSKIKIIHKKDIPENEYNEIVDLILQTTKILQERERLLWKYQPKQKKLNLKK